MRDLSIGTAGRKLQTEPGNRDFLADNPTTQFHLTIPPIEMIPLGRAWAFRGHSQVGDTEPTTQCMLH